jgi:23S rRNA (pseudouridine1915-N3)-methyltransferase
MKFTILSIGKIKEKWMKAGIAEYARRLTPFGALQIIEKSEEKVPAHPSEADITRVLDKEAESLLHFLRPDDCVILLDTKGKELSSEEIASWMEKRMVQGTSHFHFVIGGPYGNSDHLRQRADLRLSFGRITMTHQMCRLLLVEQVYRAMKIIHHEPYHL